MLGNFFYFNSLHFISLLAHTLAHIHGCGGKITRFIIDRQQRRRISCLAVRAGASGIGIAYWWPLLSPNHCLHNAHWKPSHHSDPRDVCVCQPDATPSPFFSNFWLVHVANVQVDYADKGRKEGTHDSCHVILRRGFCAKSYRSIYSYWGGDLVNFKYGCFFL